MVRIAFIIDKPGISAQAEGAVVWGWDIQLMEQKLRKVGIPNDEIVFISCLNQDAALAKLNTYPDLTVLIPLGEAALFFTTGLKSITKWHLSPLDALPKFKARKVIATFDPSAVRKDFALNLYVELALTRAKHECLTSTFTRKQYNFLLNPSLAETHDVLNYLEHELIHSVLPQDQDQHWLSVDIETGRGQINTFGFAWSSRDAIAIQTLPERCGAAELHKLFSHIERVLQLPLRKIMQNGIYEKLYCARYGINIAGKLHDTMNAQKLLWPEFNKGLDNVGRFYTNEPYWKDSGRVESEEGSRKDWGNVRDWPAHFRYNCFDTSGTFEAAIKQRADLKKRGMLDFFDNYLMQVHECMSEMCLRGLPVNKETQARLVSEYENKCTTLVSSLSMPINVRSPKQKMKLFEDKGYAIPKVRDAVKGGWRKSVNEVSLKKLRLKYPADTDIKILLEVAEYEKALSSYLRVQTDPFDGAVRFSMDVHGTETGRWSANKDPWDRGFNPQTLPSYAKELISWE